MQDPSQYFNQAQYSTITPFSFCYRYDIYTGTRQTLNIGYVPNEDMLY